MPRYSATTLAAARKFNRLLTHDRLWRGKLDSVNDDEEALHFDRLRVQAMDGLIEEIRFSDSVAKAAKLCLLTNRQANMLRTDPTSIARLYELLNVGEPKIVMNLLMSPGLDSIFRYTTPQKLAGVCRGKAPWRYHGAEGSWSMEQLVRFMSNVVIPLAEETNALIFVDAATQPCMLTYAFNEAMSAKQARWQSHGSRSAKFSVLGFTSNFLNFYKTQWQYMTSRNWFRARSQSKAWKNCENVVVHLYRGYLANCEGSYKNLDIAASLPNYVVVDGLDVRQHRYTPEELKRAADLKRTFAHEDVRAADAPDNGPEPTAKTCTSIRKGREVDKEPALKLFEALLNHWKGKVSVINFKTGSSWKPMSQMADMSWREGPAAMARAVDAVKRQDRVFFIDLRKRKYSEVMRIKNESGLSEAERASELTASQGLSTVGLLLNKEELIAAAKKDYFQHCETIFLETGCVEVFDVMSIAYFQSVLFGDGDYKTTELLNNPDTANLPQLPLHERIAQLEADNGDGAHAVATDDQIELTCNWIVDHLLACALRAEILSCDKVFFLNKERLKGGTVTGAPHVMGPATRHKPSATPLGGAQVSVSEETKVHWSSESLSTVKVTPIESAFPADANSRAHASVKAAVSGSAPPIPEPPLLPLRKRIQLATDLAVCLLHDHTKLFRSSGLCNGFHEHLLTSLTPKDVEGFTSKGVGYRNEWINAFCKEWGIAPGTLKYFVEYTKQLFGAQRNCFALDVGELLRSSNFHSININDMRGAEKLLNAVVRINRKTGEDNLQVLILLREAWDAVDVTEYLARRYKVMSRLFYFLLLVCSIAIVVLAILGDPSTDMLATILLVANETDANTTAELVDEISASIAYAIFAVSAFQAFILSFTAFSNPGRRWRSLRRAATNLRSEIWKFRTRSGRYSEDAGRHTSTRESLVTVLQAWRATTVGAADLSLSDLQRRYPASVFKHFQYSGPVAQGPCCRRECRKEHVHVCRSTCTVHDPQSHCVIGEVLLDLRQPVALFDAGAGLSFEEVQLGRLSRPTSTEGFDAVEESRTELAPVDDHFSIIDCDDYFNYRLLERISFYEQRMPGYHRQHAAFTIAVLLSSISTGFLAYLSFEEYVAIVTTIAAAVMSWHHYVDVARKLGRYSNTIFKLRNLKNWWQSLHDVERTTSENKTRLIADTEHLIAYETSHWVAALNTDFSTAKLGANTETRKRE